MIDISLPPAFSGRPGSISQSAPLCSPPRSHLRTPSCKCCHVLCCKGGYAISGHGAPLRETHVVGGFFSIGCSWQRSQFPVCKEDVNQEKNDLRLAANMAAGKLPASLCYCKQNMTFPSPITILVVYKKRKINRGQSS